MTCPDIIRGVICRSIPHSSGLLQSQPLPRLLFHTSHSWIVSCGVMRKGRHKTGHTHTQLCGKNHS